MQSFNKNMQIRVFPSPLVAFLYIYSAIFIAKTFYLTQYLYRYIFPLSRNGGGDGTAKSYPADGR